MAAGGAALGRRRGEAWPAWGAAPGPRAAPPTCSDCALTFADRPALRAHAHGKHHRAVVMADEGRDWKWRPPPRGYSSESYVLCESWDLNKVCRYGAQCVEAHGNEEFTEWKERFEYRKMKMQRACEKELYGKSYTEQLLDKWVQATSPEKVMREKLDGIEDSCSTELITTVSSKVSKREWVFVLKTRRLLKAVALLQDAHRNHFTLKQIFPGEPKPNKKGRDGQKIVEADIQSDQEWVTASTDKTVDLERGPVLEHRIKVVFSTDIYGTFRQSVVFDLGIEPVLVKHLCVDVVPVTDADKIKEIRKEIVLSSTKRWDSDNAEVVAFSSPVYPGLATPYGREACERDRDLLTSYPSPRANTLCLTQATVTERNVTKNNYRTRMHELLSVEELARCEQVARYNLTCRLRVAPSYLLAPSGMATSTAKYAHSGELFALLTLGKDVSEDTSAGRLILNNCTTVLLASSTPIAGGVKRRVYEALIEDKGKNMIYLRLSALCVRELGMRADTEFASDIQFQLNRLTYCEWHYAIDRITDYRLIFPDTALEPSIPQCYANPQAEESLDFRLNVKQKEAVFAITAPSGMEIPPILIIGPFGTGKTYTLAQAIKQLLLQPEAKILICTHSNSAADLYIKDYLHPWLEKGVTDARPLRIYYHKRWVATVDETVQQYCLIEMNGGRRSFQLPTLDDVLKHRIVVVTLSISMYLSTLGLPKGYFTHILLDEAAQAMESEALMPLAMATPTTRIVLAGDHMQLSPELFSQFAKERNLHISLLERLYDHYPANYPCKILLCENYRAHEAIICFTSELFYEQKLIASGKQPRHDKFYPLTFFTTRGEDVQDQNSTAFYNNSEVYEIVERVHELRCNWPSQWGKVDEQSIGIMTPYADQVFRIRSELRKRRMGGISVERVLNVQGKQFRAVFLSTVRTRRTCQAASEMDYGFLSNRKLLNTAITRAQSMVAVIGDPVALCSIGRCRKVWERFISICNENNSLFGITWQLLRAQLDGVDFKKTFTLNPLAPEFVPRALQQEAYIKLQIPDVVVAPLVQPGPGLSIPMPVSQINSNALIRQPNPAPMAPIYTPANPPILPYPYILYPPGTTQPGAHTNLFPLNRPPVGIPITNISHRMNPTINPWTVNSFPLASPNDHGTSAWSLKQLQKKPVEINPGVTTPLHNLQSIAPSRFVGTSPHLLTSQILPNKNHQFLPMPPSRPRISPDNSPISTSVLTDNFAGSGDIITPSFMRSAPLNISSDRIPYPSSANKYPDASLNFSKDKDIQFLQNVHFPERPPVSQSVRDIPAPLQQNANLQDLNESQDPQARWYQHLLDTQGAESASKFMEVASQRRILPPQVKPIQHFDTFLHTNDFSRNVEDVFSDKGVHNQNFVQNYNIPNGHGLLAPVGDVERSWPVPEPKHANNQYINKSLIREFENSMVLNNGMYNQNSNQREEKAFNQRNYVPNDTLEVPWQHNPTQSVPLYRRQAGQSNNVNQNDPSMPQGLLDPLDKPNSSTGAFAGYARAFSLQQTEPSLMAQHSAIPMPDRALLNGNVGLADYRLLTLPPQQRLQHQVNAEFARPLNGASLDNLDNGDNTTYASVLRQNTPKPDEDKDPIAVLRDYGHKPQTHGLSRVFGKAQTVTCDQFR